MNISFIINRNYPKVGETTFLGNVKSFKLEANYEEEDRGTLSLILFSPNQDTRVETFYKLSPNTLNDIRTYISSVVEDCILQDMSLDFTMSITDTETMFIVGVKHKGVGYEEEITTFEKDTDKVKY